MSNGNSHFEHEERGSKLTVSAVANQPTQGSLESVLKIKSNDRLASYVTVGTLEEAKELQTQLGATIRRVEAFSKSALDAERDRTYRP